MFELATRRRRRGVLAAVLIGVCAVPVILGQAFWQPEGAWAAPAGQAKPITHPLDGRENCALCHQPGAGAKPSPADHGGRNAESCQACHKTGSATSGNQAAPGAPAAAPKPASGPAAAGAASAPNPPAAAPAAPAASQPAGAPAASAALPKPVIHPIQGRENCLSCHAVGGQVWPTPDSHTGRNNDTCLMCHKTEAGTTTRADMAAEQPETDPTAASQGCRVCHSKPEFDIVSNIASRPDTVKQLESDREYAHRFIACTTCHTEHPHMSLEPVTKTSTADACGRCHVEERQEHVSSIHGKSLANGGRDAATCIDCHSTQNTPHSIARVLSPDSPAYRGSVASTCAKCHAKTEVMEKYGVPTEVYKTYTATFHGKANILSPYEITQHPKATCVNCHGYHDIKPADDPKSPVAASNLAKTCGGCHPGAGEQFAAGWLGHKEATPQQFPVVYFAERFFFFFTSSVLTFGFVFMVALELGSWILRRRPTQH